MPGPFAVTPSTSTVSLDAARQGTVTFTVKNTTKIRIRGVGRFVATPPESVHWYSIAPASPAPAPPTGQPAPDPGVRDFAPEETQTYTVNIAVPPNTAAGDYRFKLIVANEVNPDDDFTESSEVGFSVASQEKPPNKFPIWIIPVILVLLVIIILAIVLLTRDTTPPPPTETPTPTTAPTDTPTPVPAFTVTSVVTSVSPSSSNTCPTTFSFSAVITANRSGTVTYTWERSDGANSPVLSVTLNASGTATVTNTWALAATGNYGMRLRVLTPNETLSGQASFRLTCPPPIGSIIPGSVTASNVAISNITMSPNAPATVSLGNDVTINFRYATTVSGGVRIFARPFTNGALSGNYGASGSVIFTGNGTSSASFTIQTGAKTVDRIRFQVWTADQSSLLHEFFVVVDYQFR